MPVAGTNRRTFIAALGGAATWPIIVRAQRPTLPLIGFLSSRSPKDSVHLVAAFRQGLHESGYLDGQNVTVEYRWALGQYDRLLALATELVRKPVTVLVSTGGDPAAIAAKAAMAGSNIPLVFALGSDPIKLGLTTSYNQPDQNATGVNALDRAVSAKRLGLLQELVPNAATIGFLLNPNYPAAEVQWAEVHEAAGALHLDAHALRAATDEEIEAAFGAFAQERIGALAVAADPFFDTRSGQTGLLGGTLRDAYGIPHARIRGRWRSNELWDRFFGRLPPNRYLYRQGYKRHQTR
jgi:putative ABC transport system substrate-binding protein